MDAKVILEARRRIVGPNVTLLFDEPIHMVRGEGVHLYDADGNEYLDTVNNVAHVGHCHPKVLPSLLPSSRMRPRCVISKLSRKIATLSATLKHIWEADAMMWAGTSQPAWLSNSSYLKKLMHGRTAHGNQLLACILLHDA